MTTTATGPTSARTPFSSTPSGPAHPRAIVAIILVSYFLILLDNSAGRRAAAASFLIGVAPTGWWLIGARALQGVGAAVVAPSALSLLTASFPEGAQRSRAVAWYAATAGIGASLGLLVGGAAAQWISWRAGFFVNVPIGITMALLAPRYLPVARPQPGRFDLTGALAATLGVGSLVFGILEAAGRGWTDPVVLGALVLAVLVLAGLVAHERRAEQPIMPLRSSATAAAGARTSRGRSTWAR